MKHLNVNIILFEILTYLPVFGRTHQNYGTCEYKQKNCAALIKNAFEIFPNYREKQTSDLIKLFGYPVELHDIQTEDGYILNVQRISFSNVSAQSSKKVPVFCMHGGQSSSVQWVWQPSNRALVFMLADAGYDVWIGNARGNTYSQKHAWFSINDLKYWDFSQHEYGKYDFPAVVNYITNHTSQPSLYYIGHSLGAGQFFVGIALHPELKSKVRTMFAMAPAIYVGNTTNLAFRAISKVYSRYSFLKAVNIFGRGRFLPQAIGHLLKPITEICRNHWINCGICGNLVHLITGFSCQLDITTLPGLVAHMPDVTSSKTESHFSQWIQTGEFKAYDYGSSTLNQQKYGRPTPPHYNWTNVDVPVVIYYSDGDDIVVSKDVHKTVAALGSNVKEFNKIAYLSFRHIDYIIGIDADKLIYEKIIGIMDSRKYDREL